MDVYSCIQTLWHIQYTAKPFCDKCEMWIYQCQQCDCWLTQRGQLNTHQKSVQEAIQFPFKIVRICLIIITHVWGGTFITSQEIMGIKYQCEQCDWNGNKLIILTNHHQNSAY